MSRTSFVPILVLLAACGLPGDGNVVTDQRDVPTFNAVDANNGVEVVLTVDGTVTANGLVLRADANLMALLRTDVIGTTLETGVTQAVGPREALDITATVAALRAATTNNGAGVIATGIATTAFAADANNGGVVDVSGTAQTLSVYAHNGGEVLAAQLQVTDVEVDVASGGSAEVCATGAVTGKVGGGGTLVLSCGGDRSGLRVELGGNVK